MHSVLSGRRHLQSRAFTSLTGTDLAMSKPSIFYLEYTHLAWFTGSYSLDFQVAES